MFATDRYSGFIWDIYLKNREQDTLITAFRYLLGALKNQDKVFPQVIECDNEILKNHLLRDILQSPPFSIRLEPSAPHTQAQNGGAERSGGIIKEKTTAMRNGAKLPAFLIVHIFKAAVYLYNRTPKYTLFWQTPYEVYYTYLAYRDGVPVLDRKPQQAHLRAYGCMAYAMTTAAMKKEQRLQKLNPKAWIGFLVGYRSTNIYEIWNPLTNKVIAIRDVQFNEKATFSGDIKDLKDDLLHVTGDELQNLLRQVHVPDQAHGHPIHIEDEDLSGTIQLPAGQEEWLQRGTGVQSDVRDGEEQACSQRTDHPYTTAVFEPLPSPGPSPPPASALITATIIAPTEEIKEALGSCHPVQPRVTVEDEGPPRIKDVGSPCVPCREDGYRYDHRVWEAAFNAGRLAHSVGKLFLEAEKAHLQSYRDMQSWEIVDQSTAKGKQVLGYMWVYVYKFNKHGWLQKCKARLVVRGDQQLKNACGDTYASTLAGRSFRALMAIAARFDLELKQYDAVNAFVNANLPYEVFIKTPPGYPQRGKILLIRKALYGLKESPLLWQKDFTSTFRDLGLSPVPHEPCCFLCKGVLLFFYVDDIVAAYNKKNQALVDRLIQQIQERYTLTGGGDLQWFLGIEMIRDRPNRKIWLSQSDFIDKLANLVPKESLNSFPETPMASSELLPSPDLAHPGSVNRYQKKIGSILYVAVHTRPDICFAISRLARFNLNPSKLHHEAADRVILYLIGTKTLALQLGGEDSLDTWSDASFADNTLDRKSSQAYVMKLFGGAIGWRTNKQDIVTTSTTEAELLSLAQAAKEALFASRLIKELGVTLDAGPLNLWCDNQQTIRLINADVALLKTKLRHVDIHNHWLREAAEKSLIRVDYTSTSDMLADGLTKALSREPFRHFREQLGLVDITEALDLRRKTLRAISDEELADQEDTITGGEAEWKAVALESDKSVVINAPNSSRR
ncbi:hypothetical protein DL771_006402 [Monosporascus sp. 5C6A]|nr:hypothetical protein DL771_006402 [Monosporascus sp. 5C6A]